jgi:sialidase-1
MFEILESHVIYENPLPQLTSRHSFFPSIVQLANGDLLASHVLGQAFESVDQSTYLSRSTDKGRSWELLPPINIHKEREYITSDYLKLSKIENNGLLLFGYEYFRLDPDLPIGNPENGGTLPDRVIMLKSFDLGTTWSKPHEIATSFLHQVEASAPILELKSGVWVSPATGFPSWNGVLPDRQCGRLLRSIDYGNSWDDSSIIMEFPRNTISIYEQRICQMPDTGTLIVISWNEDIISGERYPNHYAVSNDDGNSFSGPYSTGVMGQASSVMPIDGNRLLALHSIRRDTDRPGIYGYIVNLKNNTWDIEYSNIIWEPQSPMVKNSRMAEVFSFLKFGQPSAIKLLDGSIAMVHWATENGQGKTIYTRLSIHS